MFANNHPTKYARPNKRQRRNVTRKTKVIALCEAVGAAWKDFCTTSSFVGFRYVYRNNRMIIDALFWVVLVPVLMYFSINFVADFLERYHSLATHTVLRTQQFPTSRSIFPAVTACSGSFMRKSKLNAFVDKYINDNADLKENVNVTEFLKVFKYYSDAGAVALSNAERVFSANNLTMRDVDFLANEDCEEIFTVCRFAGKITPCSEIFKRTMAVGGHCCSFNYPHSAERLLQRKLLRTGTFGLAGGLSFAFKKVSNENYFYSETYGNTLRVLIHEPNSSPKFRENDFFMSNAMEHALEVTTVVNTAETKVGNLPVEDRDCVFPSEKSLSRFGLYSNSNCFLQCKIDRVKKNCGCISYYYPGNNSETCSPDHFACSYGSRLVGAKQGNKTVYGQHTDCDCPDDCNVIKRYTKINSWKFTTATKYSTDDFYKNVTNEHGIVHIYFGKSTMMLLFREVSFDEIELASSIGGIVALFLGCSFVSVLEIIYFLTVRLLKFYK